MWKNYKRARYYRLIESITPVLGHLYHNYK